MNKSWLIQRLLKPYKVENTWTKLSNAFSFGGGCRHGGLSDEVMDLIKDIFRFDYMGAAEFEFGAVPTTFQAIARGVGESTYKAFKIQVKYKYKD